MSEMGGSPEATEASPDTSGEQDAGPESKAEATGGPGVEVSAEATGGPGVEASADEPGEGAPAEAGPGEQVDAADAPPAAGETGPGAGDAATEGDPAAEPGDQAGANGTQPGEKGPVDAGPGDQGPDPSDGAETVAGTSAESGSEAPPGEPGEIGPAETREDEGSARDTSDREVRPPETGDGTPQEQAFGDNRPDISRQYPSDYIESDSPGPHVDRPHESPENWANDINPAKDEVGGRTNCGECARAVQDTWSGDPTSAAKMAPGQNGEPAERMNSWAGETPQPATMSQVSDRLQQLGPGSSAIVRCNWNGGRGHYFNAVNDAGTVKAVDGQKGKVETWPPSSDGVGYNEAQMARSHAIYFDSNGKVVS